MDERNFRSTTTQRGYVYSYYYEHHGPEKPTILLLHGFPCTSRDWTAQVQFLSSKGYNIIVPDLLGYGKTSAPSDATEYKVIDMVEDVVDILDALNISGRIIGVGHDWGSILLARLLNLHKPRFIGAAFLVVGYTPPQPTAELQARLSAMAEHVGYWGFFAEDDAPQLCTQNIDSFYSLVFPQDPKVFETDLVPKGKAREWVEQNKKGPRATFWTESEQENHKNTLLRTGLQGPLNWYKMRMTGITDENESKIPQQSYTVEIPIFFAGALKDYLCVAAGLEASTAKFCPQLTVRNFDTSHWIMSEAPDELNAALGEFFTSVEWLPVQ